MHVVHKSTVAFRILILPLDLASSSLELEPAVVAVRVAVHLSLLASRLRLGFHDFGIVGDARIGIASIAAGCFDLLQQHPVELTKAFGAGRAIVFGSFLPVDSGRVATEVDTDDSVLVCFGDDRLRGLVAVFWHR